MIETEPSGCRVGDESANVPPWGSRVHVLPALGSKRLDAITNEDVQRLKVRLERKAAKTVNNVLTVLNVLLKKAVEWGVIERMPCSIKLLPVPKPAATFYDFEEYERLVTAARAMDTRAYLLVLLSGEAGLRSGEMVALEWRDVDLSRQQLCVQRSAWQGQVAVPKGGRSRYVPMTRRLADTLRNHRHLRGSRVLYQDNGEPFTEKTVQTWLLRAARRAGVENNGPHRLRHASGDAGSSSARDSGAGWARRSEHDPAVHAPESGRG
jgi:integrase